MQKTFSPLLQIGLCTFGYLYATSNTALAQVTSDGTVNTQVNQNGNVAEITGGETRGSNLFHSFQDFSVGTGNEAFFDNADSISNIFSRVTGGNISNIDGAIRANGSASLFLINPAGIIFGEGARLDIGGSFYASTASSILFEDGEFSAADLENPPLLTVNAPIGLGFRDNPGDIENNSIANDGRGLEVNIGNNISLLGGDIRFSSGNITAPGGVINLGGLTAEGTIDFADNGSLSFPEETTKSDISIANSSTVSVLSNSNGSIFIDSEIFELTSGSSLIAGITSSSTEVEAQAGNILINANDSISLSDADIFNQVESNAIGNSGDIEISTSNINLSAESRISSSTFGQGDAGNVVVDASESISVNESSDIFAVVFDSGIGNGGDISFTTNELNLTDSNSLISVSTLGQGNAGTLNINATDVIEITNEAGIFSITSSSAEGNGGSITIDANNLFVTNDGVINASTFGIGDAGIITINANELISIDGVSSNNNFDTPNGNFSSSILSTVLNNGVGNGGNVDINTRELSLTNGGQISVTTFGEGNAGTVDLNVDRALTIDGKTTDDSLRSGVFAIEGSGGTGNGGTVNITTASLSLINDGIIDTSAGVEGNAGEILIDASDSISLVNGGLIDSRTFGQGNSGEIIISADNSISLDNGDIFSAVTTNAIGNAGKINISTTNLFLTNGGQISSSTFGTGDSGLISIDATESVSINGRTPDGEFNSGIFSTVDTNGSGNSNGIEITTNSIDMGIFGRINTSTFGTGNAGKIDINASNSITINSGDILSQIEEGAIGNSGEINISTENLTLENGGDIKTLIFSFDNPETVQAGNISIDTTNLNVRGGSEIDAGVAENGIGDGGDIFVNADAISITSTGFTGIVSNVIGDAQGNAGSVTINTRILETSGSVAEISASNRSQGDAGVLNINATESISITDGGLFADIFDSDSLGNGGNLSVNSPRLEVDGTGQISVQNEGTGSGGLLDINVDNVNLINSEIIGNVSGEGDGANITINSSESITLDNSRIFSLVEEGATGNGGEIQITTESLLITNDGAISSSTLGQGNAGDIEIDARDVVINEPVKDEQFVSGIFNLVEQTGVGNAGNIDITTTNLSILDGGVISSSVRGQGNGGNIVIDSQNSISISGTTFDGEFSSGIFNIVTNTGNGNGGQITLNTKDISINDDGIVSAGNVGVGNSASVSINASSLNLDNGSIFANNQPLESTETSTIGGDINLEIANNIVIRNDGLISAQAEGNSTGGNINIDTNFVIAFPDGNNDILASAEQGQGGNVTINAGLLLGIQERPENSQTNDINASSETNGLDGTVNITTFDINPDQGVIELPIVPEETTAQACQTNRESAVKNGLTISGKGGIVPDPASPFNSLNATIDGEINSTSAIPAPIETAQGKIQPARGVEITPSGKVILTAYRTNNAGDRIPEIKPNCS